MEKKHKKGVVVIFISFVIIFCIYFYYNNGIPGIPTVCGNGICEIGENKINCPQDCNGGNGGLPEPTSGVIVSVVAPEFVTEGESTSLVARIKNTGSEEALFFVEGAIVPREENMLSFLGMSTIRSGQCCQGQENVEDKWVAIKPNEIKEVTLRFRVPYDGIRDLCGTEQYWDGCGWWPFGRLYTGYVVIANHCNWLEGVQQPGFRSLDMTKEDIGVFC